MSGIILGDCFDLVKKLDSASIDLAITSPPYADQRSATYGGTKPDEYVRWILPLGQELLRVVKPTGSFVLNIKEKVVDGERHTYVIDLIKALRSQGWLWTEEYIWHKRNSVPGKWPNRLRDGWERCLHFTRQRQFAMYQDAVKVPIGDWARSRLKNLSETDMERSITANASGFGRNMSNWTGRDWVLPSNVLHFATECGNKGHPAAFPVALPEFFIKLFTQEGDVVLDPFCGSGTTGVATARLNRQFIGFEINPTYVNVATERFDVAAATIEPLLDRAPEPKPDELFEFAA